MCDRLIYFKIFQIRQAVKHWIRIPTAALFCDGDSSYQVLRIIYPTILYFFFRFSFSQVDRRPYYIV